MFRDLSAEVRSIFKVKTTGLYPRVLVDTKPVSAVGHPGGVLLTETVRVSGLDVVLQGLSRWRKPTALARNA